MRSKDSDSRWRSRRQENEDSREGKSKIVDEELPELLNEAEEKVTDRLANFKKEEEKLIAKREAAELQEKKQQEERVKREERERERRERQRNIENEAKANAAQEQNLKERKKHEETDRAYKDFQYYRDSERFLKRGNSIRGRLDRFEKGEEEKKSNSDERESESGEEIDLHTKLEEINGEKEGYDPDKEREIQERADKVFKSYLSRQKRSGSLRLPNKTSKAKQLARSMTFEDHDLVSQQRVMVKRSDGRSRSVGSREQALEDDMSEIDEDGVVRIEEGLVLKKMAVLREKQEEDESLPRPLQQSKNQKPIARLDKKIIEGFENLNEDEKNAFEKYRNEERRAIECKNRIASLRLSNKMEEALEKEEEYHETALQISRCKRRLLHYGIEVTSVNHHGVETIRLIRDSQVIANVISSEEMSTPTPKEVIPEGSVERKLKSFQTCD